MERQRFFDIVRAALAAYEDMPSVARPIYLPKDGGYDRVSEDDIQECLNELEQLQQRG